MQLSIEVTHLEASDCYQNGLKRHCAARADAYNSFIFDNISFIHFFLKAVVETHPPGGQAVIGDDDFEDD